MKTEHDLYNEEWRAFVCSDCHPEDTEVEGEAYEQPFVVLLPDSGAQKPDFCPRCGSYLSLCEGSTGLRITNTPAERWAAKRAAEATS